MKIKTLALSAVLSSLLFIPVANAIIYNGSPLGNVDVDPSTPVSTTFTVLDHGTILDLNLAYTLDNNWASDVSVELTHGATTVLAFDAFEDNLTGVNVLLDDEAAGPITSGNYNGTFQPSNPLSAFDGMDVFGDWTLTLYDNVGFEGDGTNLTAWSIDVQIPEPSILALMALGLAGLGFSLRKNKK